MARICRCGAKFYGAIWDEVVRCPLCGGDLEAVEDFWSKERREEIDRLEEALSR